MLANPENPENRGLFAITVTSMTGADDAARRLTGPRVPRAKGMQSICPVPVVGLAWPQPDLLCWLCSRGTPKMNGPVSVRVAFQ